MKKLILSLLTCSVIALTAWSQHFKKDGTPDMRYRENKGMYSNPNYSQPTYSQPSYRPQENNVNPSHERVSEYQRENGTRVDSYERTTPNETKKDNYSTEGNRNPFTDKKGYKKPE